MAGCTVYVLLLLTVVWLLVSGYGSNQWLLVSATISCPNPLSTYSLPSYQTATISIPSSTSSSFPTTILVNSSNIVTFSTSSSVNLTSGSNVSISCNPQGTGGHVSYVFDSRSPLFTPLIIRCAMDGNWYYSINASSPLLVLINASVTETSRTQPLTLLPSALNSLSTSLTTFCSPASFPATTATDSSLLRGYRANCSLPLLTSTASATGAAAGTVVFISSVSDSSIISLTATVQCNATGLYQPYLGYVSPAGLISTVNVSATQTCLRGGSWSPNVTALCEASAKPSVIHFQPLNISHNAVPAGWLSSSRVSPFIGVLPLTGQTLLIGGLTYNTSASTPNAFTFNNDVWLSSGPNLGQANWTLVSGGQSALASFPITVTSPAVSLDPITGCVYVLLGASRSQDVPRLSSSASLYSSCDYKHWSVTSSPSAANAGSFPSARFSAQLISIPPPISQPIARYTGITSTGHINNTWIWSDAITESTLLFFGGYTSSFSTAADMWILPTPQAAIAMAAASNSSIVWQQVPVSTIGVPSIVISRGEASMGLLMNSAVCNSRAATAAGVGACVLLIGGMNLSPTQLTLYNDVWLSPTGGQTWQLLSAGAPFSPRAGASLAVDSANEIIALAGGVTSPNPLSPFDLTLFSNRVPVSDVYFSFDGGLTWIAPNALQTPVTRFTVAFAVDSSLELFGGYPPSNSADLTGDLILSDVTGNSSSSIYVSTFSFADQYSLSMQLIFNSSTPIITQLPLCHSGLQCLPATLPDPTTILPLINTAPYTQFTQALQNLDTALTYYTMGTSVNPPINLTTPFGYDTWFIGAFNYSTVQLDTSTFNAAAAAIDFADAAATCSFLSSSCSCPPLAELMSPTPVPSYWSISTGLVNGVQTMTIQCPNTTSLLETNPSPSVAINPFFFDPTSPLFAPYSYTCSAEGVWSAPLPPLDYCSTAFLNAPPVLCANNETVSTVVRSTLPSTCAYQCGCLYDFSSLISSPLLFNVSSTTALSTVTSTSIINTVTVHTTTNSSITTTTLYALNLCGHPLGNLSLSPATAAAFHLNSTTSTIDCGLSWFCSATVNVSTQMSKTDQSNSTTQLAQNVSSIVVQSLLPVMTISTQAATTSSVVDLSSYYSYNWTAAANLAHTLLSLHISNTTSACPSNNNKNNGKPTITSLTVQYVCDSTASSGSARISSVVLNPSNCSAVITVASFAACQPVNLTSTALVVSQAPICPHVMCPLSSLFPSPSTLIILGTDSNLALTATANCDLAVWANPALTVRTGDATVQTCQADGTWYPAVTEECVFQDQFYMLPAPGASLPVTQLTGQWLPHPYVAQFSTLLGAHFYLLLGTRSTSASSILNPSVLPNASALASASLSVPLYTSTSLTGSWNQLAGGVNNPSSSAFTFPWSLTRYSITHDPNIQTQCIYVIGGLNASTNEYSNTLYRSCSANGVEVGSSWQTVNESSSSIFAPRADPTVIAVPPPLPNATSIDTTNGNANSDPNADLTSEAYYLLIVIGGETGNTPSNSTLLNDVWLSTDQSQTWVQVTPAAAFSPRSSAAVTASITGATCSNTFASGCLMLVGGKASMYNTALNDVWLSSDAGTNFLLMTAYAPFIPRYAADLVVHSGSQIIILTGGVSISNSSTIDSVTRLPLPVYNLCTDIWLSLDGGWDWLPLLVIPTATQSFPYGMYAMDYGLATPFFTELPQDDNLYLLGGQALKSPYLLTTDLLKSNEQFPPSAYGWSSSAPWLSNVLQTASPQINSRSSVFNVPQCGGGLACIPVSSAVGYLFSSVDYALNASYTVDLFDQQMITCPFVDPLQGGCGCYNAFNGTLQPYWSVQANALASANLNASYLPIGSSVTISCSTDITNLYSNYMFNSSSVLFSPYTLTCTSDGLWSTNLPPSTYCTPNYLLSLNSRSSSRCKPSLVPITVSVTSVSPISTALVPGDNRPTLDPSNCVYSCGCFWDLTAAAAAVPILSYEATIESTSYFYVNFSSGVTVQCGTDPSCKGLNGTGVAIGNITLYYDVIVVTTPCGMLMSQVALTGGLAHMTKDSLCRQSIACAVIQSIHVFTFTPYLAAGSSTPSSGNNSSSSGTPEMVEFQLSMNLSTAFSSNTLYGLASLGTSSFQSQYTMNWLPATNFVPGSTLVQNGPVNLQVSSSVYTSTVDPNNALDTNVCTAVQLITAYVCTSSMAGSTLPQSMILADVTRSVTSNGICVYSLSINTALVCTPLVNITQTTLVPTTVNQTLCASASCPLPVVSSNQAIIQVTTNSLNQLTATVNCNLTNNGGILTGVATQTCQNGVWSPSAPAQCVIFPQQTCHLISAVNASQINCAVNEIVVSGGGNCNDTNQDFNQTVNAPLASMQGWQVLCLNSGVPPSLIYATCCLADTNTFLFTPAEYAAQTALTFSALPSSSFQQCEWASNTTAVTTQGQLQCRGNKQLIAGGVACPLYSQILFSYLDQYGVLQYECGFPSSSWQSSFQASPLTQAIATGVCCAAFAPGVCRYQSVPYLTDYGYPASITCQSANPAYSSLQLLPGTNTAMAQTLPISISQSLIQPSEYSCSEATFMCCDILPVQNPPQASQTFCDPYEPVITNGVGLIVTNNPEFPYALYSTWTIECPTGYTYLSGAASITCTETAEWKGVLANGTVVSELGVCLSISTTECVTVEVREQPAQGNCQFQCGCFYDLSAYSSTTLEALDSRPNTFTYDINLCGNPITNSDCGSNVWLCQHATATVGKTYTNMNSYYTMAPYADGHTMKWSGPGNGAGTLGTGCPPRAAIIYFDCNSRATTPIISVHENPTCTYVFTIQTNAVCNYVQPTEVFAQPGQLTTLSCPAHDQVTWVMVQAGVSCPKGFHVQSSQPSQLIHTNKSHYQIPSFTLSCTM